MLLKNRLFSATITQMASKPHKKDEQAGSVTVNKKAYMNFELVDKFEAGMSLLGTEVKSLRDGQADLEGSYARILGDQCWLVGAKIAQYKQASARSTNLPEKENSCSINPKFVD